MHFMLGPEKQKQLILTKLLLCAGNCVGYLKFTISYIFSLHITEWNWCYYFFIHRDAKKPVQVIYLISSRTQVQTQLVFSDLNLLHIPCDIKFILLFMCGIRKYLLAQEIIYSPVLMSPGEACSKSGYHRGGEGLFHIVAANPSC